MFGKKKKPQYRTLEERIVWLWATKGMKVLEMNCKPQDDGSFVWTVHARHADKKQLQREGGMETGTGGGGEDRQEG